MCVTQLLSKGEWGLCVYKNIEKIDEKTLGNTKLDTLRINYCFVKIVRAFHCFLDMLQN